MDPCINIDFLNTMLRLIFCKSIGLTSCCMWAHNYKFGQCCEMFGNCGLLLLSTMII